VNELLPWHQESWERFQWLKQFKKIPHAIMLYGAPGLGKMHFARMLTRSLFCLQPSSQELACGLCKNCILISAQTHPDYQEVIAQEKEAIKIEDIRGIQSKLFHSAQQGGWKVILISPAEAMTLGAANALLKILEEPPANTVFLLVTTALQQLPATIRSRCEKWAFPGVAENLALAWLQENKSGNNEIELLALLRQNNHAPLAVMNLLSTEVKESPEVLLNEFNDFQAQKLSLTELAARWSKYNLPRVLQFFLHYSVDILRINYAGEKAVLHFCHHSVELKQIAPKISITKLFAFYDALVRIGHDCAQVTNLNKQLLLEQLMLKWMAVRL